jgi:hypothetical protein
MNRRPLVGKVKYAKIGEEVEIVVPMEFIRCGYALNFEILCDKHAKDVYPIADELYASLYKLPHPSEPGIPLLGDLFSLNTGASNIKDKDGRVYSYLVSAVCSKILKDRGWGGKERRIFEEPIAPYRLRTKEPWKVEGKRYVKTGTRYSASGGWSDYYGEYDYEPGGLDDEKTHCIYSISSDRDYLDILSANVKRTSK